MDDPPPPTTSRRSHKQLTRRASKTHPLTLLSSRISGITAKKPIKAYKASSKDTKWKNRSHRVLNAEDGAGQIPVEAVLFFGDLNYRVERPRGEIERLHKQLVKSSSKAAGRPGRSEADAILSEWRSGASTNTTSTSNRTDISSNYFKHTDAAQRVLLEKKLDRLLRFDQLNQQRRFGKVLRGFREGSIRFPPTYKYDKEAGQFDSSSKQRAPAWTDRILYYNRALESTPLGLRSGASVVDRLTAGLATPRSASEFALDQAAPDSCHVPGSTKELLELVDYYSVDARTSDHRPVCATFRLNL